MSKPSRKNALRALKRDERYTAEYKRKNQEITVNIIETTAETVETTALALHEVDGEKLMSHHDLAERLGVEAKNLLATIEIAKQSPAFGITLAGKAYSGKRGRPLEHTYLNEYQATTVTLMSHSPSAALVRDEVVRVFLAVKNGTHDGAMSLGQFQHACAAQIAQVRDISTEALSLSSENSARIELVVRAQSLTNGAVADLRQAVTALAAASRLAPVPEPGDTAYHTMEYLAGRAMGPANGVDASEEDTERLFTAIGLFETHRGRFVQTNRATAYAGRMSSGNLGWARTLVPELRRAHLGVD